MALTIRPQESTVLGNTHAVFADVTFDNSYATGGEALTPQLLGQSPALSIVHVATNPQARYTFGYDYAAGKLKAFDGTQTEVASATDLSAVTTRVFAVIA